MYMSDTLNLANSIWPNGMKVDSDGHAVFYPLGTNKVEVPTSSSAWPKGNKLISTFVYQDDKLVGFVDTKALTTNSYKAIYLPYEHIEAEFSAINKGLLQIHAPKAITKKASWKNSGVEDIPEAQYKYKGCKSFYELKASDAYYQTSNIVNGVWSEPLWDLEEGGDGQYSGGMFWECTNLTSFNTDLPSLIHGEYMFYASNISEFSSDLSSLECCDYMFYYCSKLASFSSDLSSLTDGNNMFHYCENLSEFSSDLSSLTNGYQMFYGCENLTSFASDSSGSPVNLSSLTNGHAMFEYCHNLTSFSSDLSSLTDGSAMFDYCTKLTSFSSDLSRLTDGSAMFSNCTNITSFSSDLSRLENGHGMFHWCSNLTSFSSDLSNLGYGYSMFDGCSKLTSFNSNLSSLTNGTYMFAQCKLDTHSIKNIADTIKDFYENSAATIHIGIGKSYPNTEEEAAFNKIASKGWTVYVNGSKYTPTSPAAITTLDENGEETVTPIPFWAKPVQTDEEHAQYVDSEGNFFNILGGQFIYGDDISTYGMFTCEEDAAANMRLTPYIKPVERN